MGSVMIVLVECWSEVLMSLVDFVEGLRADSHRRSAVDGAYKRHEA